MKKEYYIQSFKDEKFAGNNGPYTFDECEGFINYHLTEDEDKETAKMLLLEEGTVDFETEHKDYGNYSFKIYKRRY